MSHGQHADGRFCVLHLHAGNMLGGIESLLLTIADCAKLAPNIRHEFALIFDGEFAKRLRGHGAVVHLLPEVRLRHLPSIYQSRRQFRLLLDQFCFDAVVAHSSWTQFLFSDIARERSISQVFWMHGPCDGHWLQRLASFQVPDFTICNSKYTCSTLDRCYARVRSRVLYAPVPKSEPAQPRDEVRSALGLKASEVMLFIAARMESWKGHRELVRAAANLNTDVEWRLLVAGAPNSASQVSYYESLQREASGLKLSDRVRFLGYRSDVRELMAAADIYCQPNTAPEPFGVVYVEALHAGVPVVTSATGGAREILDRNTGIMVEPGNVDALTAALTLLIENRELRVRLGNAGPARAIKLCDPARQMNCLNEILQSVNRDTGDARS